VNGIGKEETALVAWLDGLNAAESQDAVRAGIEYARRRGAWPAWERAGVRAMEQQEPFGGWAWGGYVAAEMARRQGDPRTSLRLAVMVRDRARSLGEEQWAALMSGQIADILSAQGDLTEALRIRREDELPVYEKLGDIREKAVTQGKVAMILNDRGDLPEALRILKVEVLPVFAKLGAPRETAWAERLCAAIVSKQTRPPQPEKP
jgi:hypothetical protein